MQGHLSPLLDLVCSQPEVATGILRWLCHWPPAADSDNELDRASSNSPYRCVSLRDTAQSIFALRATCTAFAHWEDSLQLTDLLTGRQRPGSFTSDGGFAYTYPVVVDAIDAAHGPRVPEDFDTIIAAIRASVTAPGDQTRCAVTISLNAGVYQLTEPIAMHDGLRLIGRCAPGAAVLHFQDTVGFTSGATGAEVRNIDIRSTSSKDIADLAGTDTSAPALYSVWVHGGDLLVRDCKITPASGIHGVLIGTCDAGLGGTHTSCSGQMPQLVRCHVHGGTVAGVRIDCTSAKLINCTIRGLELAYSTPGTSIHRCTLHGAGRNAVVCHDQAHATLMHCHISGGEECVRVCDSSDVSLLECQVHNGIKAGVSAEDGGTEVRVEGGSVSGSGNMRVAVSGDALVWMDGKLFATSLPEDRPQPRQPGAQASRLHTECSERPADDEQMDAAPGCSAMHRERRMWASASNHRPQVDVNMVVVHRERRRVSQSMWSRCASFWPLIKLVLVCAASLSSIKWVMKKYAPRADGQQQRFIWVRLFLGAVQNIQKSMRM